MTTLEYKNWMQKAFLYVEAALGEELATPGRICMTEEYFRTALVRGLAASRPDLAHRVATEHDVSWSANQCCFCSAQPGSGRRLQHDVVITPDGSDNGLLLEAKWIKKSAAAVVASDLLKLIISRGTDAESKAKRCYLLLGGDGAALSDTLAKLRDAKVDLRWSNAGRGVTKASRVLNTGRMLGTELGKKALESLIGWGGEPNRHYRSTPVFWESVKITRRFDPWVKTIDGTGWRAVLFEIHHHGADKLHKELYQEAVGKCLRENCT